jgi:hypothetical protein
MLSGEVTNANDVLETALVTRRFLVQVLGVDKVEPAR